MSGKSGKKVSKGPSAASGGKGKSAGTSAPQTGGSNSVIERLMSEGTELMRRLEAASTLGRSDVESAVHELLDRYKQISIMNKVDSKREELLQAQIEDLQRRNRFAFDETNAIREEYGNIEAKIDKLDKLSKQLSSRLKSIEAKATDEVKDEKENRLRMSYQFSSTIKDISQKLDLLGKRREQVTTDNARLKQVLRDCLEEFDRDQELQRQLGEAGEDMSAFEMLKSDSMEAVNAEELLESERQDMETEDDISKIVLLRSREDLLKSHTVKFMEIFDSFQSRLTKSNELFQLKQSRVEEMTKSIRSMEKSNQSLSKRVTDCSGSTRLLLDQMDKLRQDKAKYEKMVEKHKGLIEKFKADIATMEQQDSK
ncbi:hypothetical protein EON65_16875 [archaeon]|nr:MAG: hypothetical protein EON65_16875 [archaeon]